MIIFGRRNEYTGFSRWCVSVMDERVNKESEKRIIKQFKKKRGELVHPFSSREMQVENMGMKISLYTLGHLWLYLLMEEYGYAEYLREVIDYAIRNRNALFEWEIDDAVSRDLSEILGKYNLQFKRYLKDNFAISEYDEIDRKSKNIDEPLLRLTKFLVLAELETAKAIYEDGMDLRSFFEDNGSIINAFYLQIVMLGEEQQIVEKVPEWFVDIIQKNMECYYEKSDMKYYPRMEKLFPFLDGYASVFEKEWYLLDDVQVIVSKFLYSIQVFKELSVSLLGLNGILSAESTRILFDNYWQSKYLIANDKVMEYRDFVLKRMRLHILKRDDGSDVNIGELFREVKDGIFDLIPVNGDFLQSQLENMRFN